MQEDTGIDRDFNVIIISIIGEPNVSAYLHAESNSIKDHQGKK